MKVTGVVRRTAGIPRPATPAEQARAADAAIAARVNLAAWYGRNIETVACIGCKTMGPGNKAYNGGAYLGFGACYACRAIARRQ